MELNITYGFGRSILGEIGLGVINNKICYLAFCNESFDLKQQLQKAFPIKSLILARNDKYCQHYISNLSFHSSCKAVAIGTSFQIKVWQSLLEIPFGEKVSYKQVAQNIDHPHAIRAVAHAVAQNKISYFIPCHRVIGTDGSLRGYHWGLKKKQLLLEYEQNFYKTVK